MAQGLTAEGALVRINTGTEQSPTWTPIAERSQANISKSGETIDMTSFDSEGFREFKPGLRNATLSASGNYVPSDTGYEALEDAWMDGVNVPGVQVLWRTNPGETPAKYQGWKWDSALVTDLSEDGSVGDKVNLNLSLQLNGKPDKLEDYEAS